MTGLGERMVRDGPNGAVAYIGCNTGGQPCGMTLLDGFVAALADLPEPTLGDCWVRAVDHYYEAEHLATITPNARLVSGQHLLPGHEIHGLRRPGDSVAGVGPMTLFVGWVGPTISSGSGPGRSQMNSTTPLYFRVSPSCSSQLSVQLAVNQPGRRAGSRNSQESDVETSRTVIWGQVVGFRPLPIAYMEMSRWWSDKSPAAGASTCINLISRLVHPPPARTRSGSKGRKPLLPELGLERSVRALARVSASVVFLFSHLVGRYRIPHRS